jgi:hypothetical protein
MTVRGNKKLVLVALGVVGLAFILRLVTAFLPRGHGVSDLADGLPFLFFLLFLSVMWNRLSRLEAEHGPDYVQPTPPYARALLVVLVGVAVALATVAFFLARR